MLESGWPAASHSLMQSSHSDDDTFSNRLHICGATAFYITGHQNTQVDIIQIQFLIGHNMELLIPPMPKQNKKKTKIFLFHLKPIIAAVGCFSIKTILVQSIRVLGIQISKSGINSSMYNQCTCTEINELCSCEQSKYMIIQFKNYSIDFKNITEKKKISTSANVYSKDLWP